MNEQARLQELYEYRVLDTLPEKELDELVEIASVICDTPISLVSFIDYERQWFKAKKGVDEEGTARQHSFCQHALQNPKEVLVVNDPLNDERFKTNPYVLGSPNIRFYAGAPLETPKGNVLGTLCVVDDKPRHITESQKRALQLLAKKAIGYLETRKLILEQDDKIEVSAARLRKLSDQAPGAIFQLEMAPNGRLSFPFISKGITTVHQHLNPADLKINPEKVFAVIHPDDLGTIKASLQESYLNLTNWSIEYRAIADNGATVWHWANAKPERREDGSVVWYGTFQDITERKEYIKTLEQLLFEISHVMRKPVANILGLTAALSKKNIDEETLRTALGYIRAESEDMDKYIKQLNATYYETMLKVSDQLLMNKI
ncbi:PAS domain-containing protein [Adhaeribacter swui]|uniref:histidine kinase n=1 Tax=Adhaeribacter swui TaxID=2086471 RepID=A0A7G7G9D2_9BACT|nr:GAF domain-containing protein [Adhaeribacter swui]QNF33766.1 PAS domain-containing protein [Adhaeribacter swui]